MAALASGAVFAGYTIERLLGSGGMGEVYVARHPRLPRSDAVKVLAAEFTRDDSYRRRFEREADLAASLSHPGIVSVHDRGEFDGRLWIALELIDGIDLSASLAAASGGISGPDVTRAITEVADALDYAGARGLVHRDVKPANILLGRTGHYLLTDFGIARMGPETSDLTGTGLTVGTVAYASPEQMQGQPVDPRSDQYSLAATAFHLLTGAKPFPGTNPVAVIMAHAQQPVPSVRAQRPDLSPHVDSVIERAMAKSPGNRFPTSKDFANALGDALAATVSHPRAQAAPGVPTPASADRYAATVIRPDHIGYLPPPAPPIWPGQGGAAPSGRNRTVPMVVGALLAAVVLVVVGVLGFRAFGNQAGAAEAAQLPRRPVTPMLPSLERRPDTPIWTMQDLPGPPGSYPSRAEVLGGDSEIVLRGRNYYLSDGGNIDYLDVLDAGTGRLRDGAEPIVLDTTQRRFGRCVVSESRSAAACHLERSTEATDQVVIVDLAANRVIGTVTAAGRIDELIAAGERFVFVDQPDRPQSPILRSVGVDGRELPPIQWSGESAARRSDEPRHSIELFGLVRLAVIHSAPDPSRPLSKWEFHVVRLEDGTEIFRRDTVEQIGTDDWNVFLDGFVVADGAAPAGIYDRNGDRTADLPAGWRPSEHSLSAEKGPTETSVPTAIRTEDSETTYAGISPRNGTVLWQNQSYSADDYPERLLLRGIGTLIATADTGRVIDAYTGEYVIPGYLPDGAELGTDGNRIAVATSGSGSGTTLEVWNSDGEVWKISSEFEPVAIGGKVYVGNLRLF
ncbi:serine/threonine-protein kinase [Nocardia sp. NBC_01329]|uniref:serine/threonine-protein kinase n=1 Tax=Nocardia sp. NBC_01329 TaxID=2903594 RepID=UPI002E15E387|nr:protein kinase [Nocardia sp. NBC_01329]